MTTPPRTSPSDSALADRAPRFGLHFTPTSSSWLNLVERWFAELICSWIETWNNDPKPFVWTKTADEILDAIARYCTRINESRH